VTPLPDVLVIGGGAAGAATAAALARRGAAVTIVDPNEPGSGAGWRASAGMLAAQIEASADHPLFGLALAGRAVLRRQIPELAASVGLPIEQLQCGILEVSRSPAVVQEFAERVASQRQQAQRADALSGDEVAESWPWLGECAGGFWSPDDGAVDPVALVTASLADAARLGTRIVRDTIGALENDGDRAAGARGKLGRYAAGAVVIAGGAWSGRIAALPRPVSVEPLRGAIAAFPWPDRIDSAVVYGDRCYLLRRGDEMLVGATREHAGFDVAVSDTALAAVVARAAQLYPPLAQLQPLRSWAGLRPATPDGLPIIGPEPRRRGLWYATGHGRNGILLSGITGELIAQQIAGESIELDLSAFRPERFWNE
jgi:glycine oxidase